MTTLRRELRQVILNKIMGFYNLGELGYAPDLEKLADTITDAVLEIRAFAKLEESENFGKKKGDLLDGMLHYAKVADEKVGKRIAMQERAERELLRIRYNLKGAHQTEIDRFITFLLAEEKKGLTIEKFIEWVFGDEFWVDKISSLQKVMELFYRQEESKSKRADGPRLRTE